MAKTILSHTGLFNFGTIDTMLTSLKHVFLEHDIQFRTYKKIMIVIIESLENICKYNNSFEDFVRTREEYLPTFELSMDDDVITLKTSNPVRLEDVQKLRRSIERVNLPDRQSLKALYQEVISDGQFSSNGGAGLGFIEMARTSGNRLQYKFEEVTEQYAIYTIIVTFAC